MKPRQAFKQYQEKAVKASRISAEAKDWRVVALLGMQVCLAADTGELVRFMPEKGGWGSDWPDPLQNIPLDLGWKLKEEDGESV